MNRHGFGNWSEIAEFIGNGKTREDVEEHYTDVYVKADNFLPVSVHVIVGEA